MTNDQVSQGMGKVITNNNHFFKSNSNVSISNVSQEKKSCGITKTMSPLKYKTTNDGFYGGKTPSKRHSKLFQVRGLLLRANKNMHIINIQGCIVNLKLSTSSWNTNEVLIKRTDGFTR